jgi:glycerol-3-phosphate dehydrogenase
VIKNQAIGEKLVHMFASPRLHVQLVCSDPKTTELYSSLKNVFAIILGYYQVQGLEMSSIGYYACKIYREIDELIGML